MKKVQWKKFNHVDFAIAKDIDKLLNENILIEINLLSAEISIKNQ